METTDKFDIWGIVEVMGHKRFAGHITEQTIAGSALVRVDVPEITTAAGNNINAFSKLIGIGSVYCITPTSEDVARKMAVQLAMYDSSPLPVYIPEERQIPATVGGSDDDDDVDLPL